MTALTTRQRDLLHLLLTTPTPQGAGELAKQMQLTTRQVNYGLKGLDRWLAQRGVTLKVTPGVGVEIECSPDQTVSLQEELDAETTFQLVLSADQRQQLIAFLLLVTDEPFITYQFQQLTQMSRTTVLKDLDSVAEWLVSHNLLLERRPNYGIWVEGNEQQRRQAMMALLWGEIPFSDTLFSITHTEGLRFALGEDVDLLPIVKQVSDQLSQWNMQRTLSHVAYAESQLGGRFTDDAVLLLALAFAIQTQRVQARQTVNIKTKQLKQLQTWSTWTVAVEISHRLGWRQVQAWPDAEVALLAMYLLAAPRNERWPGDLDIDGGFIGLVDTLLAQIAAAYGFPVLQQDRTLRDGLLIHIIPACLRQRFQLWMPSSLFRTDLPERYVFEQQLAQKLARIVEERTAVSLPSFEINTLAMLLRAAYIRERPTNVRDIIVVCPSGMATAQLLVARLKTRFPGLGDLTVLSLRELNPAKTAVADLVITTVPLSPTIRETADVIQVHPLLLPEDIETITQWLA